MTTQEALNIVRNRWGHSDLEIQTAGLVLADRVEMLESHIETWTSDYKSLAKKLDAAEKLAHTWQVRYETQKAAAELLEADVDLSLYGKGEPKSLEELKASHDRLLCTCPRDSTLIEKSCPVHGGWFPQGECTCPPEWTAQCRSSACPRNRTKNTRDWL